jgi:UDP-N-acetylmuramate dehydrogenase
METANAKLRGRLVMGEPLARHSTWRCGGPAARYFEPADQHDLATFLGALPTAEPICWLGLGSNMLVRDGGFPGTVIATAGLDRYEWLDEAHLQAECGVPCARLARAAAARDRGGLEFLAGIPGSLGGALYMNAGALGSEIWNFVGAVTTIDRQGRLRRRERAEFAPGYRHVAQPEPAWFLSAILHLPATADGQGHARIRRVLAHRSQSQPTGQATCGSVFKNPPGDFAGRLIEQCGLKGHRIGGCHVSTVHANFIVNDMRASAADIEALISHVQSTVLAAVGVRLETEVEFVGRAVEEITP